MSFSEEAIPERIRARFWSYVSKGDPHDCWEWTKSSGSHGYGQMGWVENGVCRMYLAHRLSYVLSVGTIPSELTIDHLCRNRVCCNPSHLRLLTNLENARDNGMSGKTHCKHGHEFTEINTRLNRLGHRYCRACGVTSNKNRQSKEKV